MTSFDPTLLLPSLDDDAEPGTPWAPLPPLTFLSSYPHIDHFGTTAALRTLLSPHYDSILILDAFEPVLEIHGILTGTNDWFPTDEGAQPRTSELYAELRRLHIALDNEYPGFLDTMLLKQIKTIWDMWGSSRLLVNNFTGSLATLLPMVPTNTKLLYFTPIQMRFAHLTDERLEPVYASDQARLLEELEKRT